MNTQSRQHPAAEVTVPMCVGLWAAAIALAPTPALKLVLAAPAVLLPLLWWSVLNSQLWVKLFFFTAILLPPLPIHIGARSLHLAVLWAALGLFVGILRFRRWQSLPASLTTAFAGFTAALLLSLTLAAIYSGADIALASFARVLLFAIGPYVFLYTLAGGDRANALDAFHLTRLLFGVSVIAALFACLDFYFQFPAPEGYGQQFVWLTEGVFRRAQGLFYEASTLGNFCVFFLIMIAVALFRPRAERPCATFWLLTGGAVLGTALVLSFSRASLLNLIIAICTLAYLQESRVRRKLLVLLIGAAATAAIVYLLFPTFAQSYWSRLTASVQYLWSAPEGVLSGRVGSWTTLVEFISREPWTMLFGIGYKSLPYSNYVGSTVIGDNTYLTLLIETGLVGLSSFLFLNFQILRHAFRATRSANSPARFFGAWIFCFWIGELVQMLSGDLVTYWRVLPIYFWTLAIAIKESRRTQQNASGNE